jgi:hypothetical protein
MMNPPYTSSPLQHHIPNPNPNAEANYINLSIQGMAQAAEMSEKAYDPNTFRANNFGFTNGQNGWNGLGSVNINPMASVNKIPNPLVDMGPGGIAVPDPVLEVGPDPMPRPGPGPGPGPGDMGFDWLNWMSTANIAMGPVEEQYGIH